MGVDTLRLIRPDMDYLESYTVALERGWSPSSMVDNSAKLLGLLMQNPEKHAADLAAYSAKGADYIHWWMWDGGFCGFVLLMHAAGTTALLPHLPGHLGYNVVPWKRRQGYASRALALAKPLFAARGFGSLEVMCREDNAASRRVLEKSGAVWRETRVFATYGPEPRCRYEVPL